MRGEREREMRVKRARNTDRKIESQMKRERTHADPHEKERRIHRQREEHKQTQTYTTYGECLIVTGADFVECAIVDSNDIHSFLSKSFNPDG